MCMKRFNSNGSTKRLVESDIPTRKSLSQIWINNLCKLMILHLTIYNTVYTFFMHVIGIALIRNI